jgi:hypothetical protein
MNRQCARVAKSVLGRSSCDLVVPTRKAVKNPGKWIYCEFEILRAYSPAAPWQSKQEVPLEGPMHPRNHSRLTGWARNNAQACNHAVAE